MKVFLAPIGLHSPAMVRISKALSTHLPSHHSIVQSQEEADLCIFYPIGYDWTEHFAECIVRGQKYALVQCCYKTSGGTFEMWKPWWDKAVVVWSYLDLVTPQRFEITTHSDSKRKYIDQTITDFNYYSAPLGIDDAFLQPILTHPKRDYIVTTGTVHGVGAEAIEECWGAAGRCNLDVVHVGTWPVGIENGIDINSDITIYNLTNVRQVTNVTDRTLRGIYQNALYTCSLRYVEGFELPALESLSCGTRAIVFTQPATTKWYFKYADFVPECEGEELVNRLVDKFSLSHYEPLSQSTIEEVRRMFDWRVICERFWKIVDMEVHNESGV